MIFVTVGAQMPFDRLIQAVDDWAGRNPGNDVFAQIGPSRYRPSHFRYACFLKPERFRAIFEDAALIVAHAGMGSIITALEYGKPILVMPRRGDLAETRNDHQVATARQFSELGVIEVAADAEQLAEQMDRLVGGWCRSPEKELHRRLQDDGCGMKGTEGCRKHVRSQPCPRLLTGLQAFVHGQPIEALAGTLRKPVRPEGAPGQRVVPAGTRQE